ncbi:QcrA and Rieske domain-containing protein [Algoriphagus algorifonticola]|uniref:QcrA and Rieske domain-containing protein n=1 Tax=Algoriphagus algorifonticola TaxID=2593007 RepID=UPI0011A84181|nr:Rieske 2Fe-2S domain-containing protein [Algoriphagus algorifonticola]
MEKFETKSGNLSSSRREFLEKSGSIAVMSLFGLGFFTACSSSDDMDPQQPPQTPPPTSGGSNGITVSGNTVRIDLDVQTGLKTSGAWLLVVDAQTLVVNVNGSYNALTSVCTHTGCDRNWTFGSNKFVCSCHGSEFDTNGNVLKGPANQPLRSFSTSLNNNILTITK